LLVPGTIAAYQRQGTAGFVVSLSASQSHVPYVIEPRMPLFQQRLGEGRAAQRALAAMYGDPGLIKGEQPLPAYFDHAKAKELGERWVEANVGFRGEATAKFEKYAKLLNEPVQPTDSRGPERVLAPYFIQSSEDWTAASDRLFEATMKAASAEKISCNRVVAVGDVGDLQTRLAAYSDDEMCIWVSDFDELAVDLEELRAYLTAIRSTESALFALYGGFFAVLASSAGLRGASHGIGYGESRKWLELPKTGAPPARYYSRQIHRFVSQDLAQQLYLVNPEFFRCDCVDCNGGGGPATLQYHDLMHHSVRARCDEIRQWVGIAPDVMARRLAQEHESYVAAIDSLPKVLKDRAITLAEHIPRWSSAVQPDT
jgi:hypothetical protein